MTGSHETKKNEDPKNAMAIIYKRRAVRDYLPQKIDKATIRFLLDAAVHAPTAMHEEPWSFVIIQDKKILKSLSDSAKAIIQKEAQGSTSGQAKHIFDIVNEPDFNIFYNANSLIVIYSKFATQFVLADCWLAAENLMLAACAKGLGTCVIGLAVSALNTSEWKTKLDISENMTAIAPIILGFPASETPVVSRKPPKILVWK